MVSSVENLKVFKKSHDLTLDLYKVTQHFPSEERFGLVSQIRRASGSICANLMEGSHRNSTGEYRQFVGISRGSVGELKYHMMLAKDLKYISDEIYLRSIDEINSVSQMLSGLVKSLESTRSHAHAHSHANNKRAYA